MAAPWARGAEVRIVGKIHGQETVNVWTMATNTVVNDGPALDQLLLDLATAMRECVAEFLLPAVTSDWEFVQCDARTIYPAPGDPIVATAQAGGNVGERGATSVSFAAQLVNIRTGNGGRRGRGRKFLPPPGEADMTASAIDDATLVLLAAFLACVAEKFIGAGSQPWRIGVLSRKDLTGIGGSFDNAFREATQLNPVRNAALLSSRKVGKGS